uniref:Uncharacterized protein n=1 Tax=Hyaloperonospora arabidopsidis (strain Emoy2) TaxID=559515 RepID=M4C1S5_HYAAE
MSRSETPYQWSQKYALFRKHFQRGALSHTDWKKVDSAYDLMCVELSVQLTRHDPVIKEIAPFTTPREFLLWCHWYFPILVFATVSMKKVYFVDMEKHHQHILMYMLEKNMVTAYLFRAHMSENCCVRDTDSTCSFVSKKAVEELRSVNRELMPESATVNTGLKKNQESTVGNRSQLGPR